MTCNITKKISMYIYLYKTKGVSGMILLNLMKTWEFGILTICKIIAK